MARPVKVWTPEKMRAEITRLENEQKEIGNQIERLKGNLEKAETAAKLQAEINADLNGGEKSQTVPEVVPAPKGKAKAKAA